MVDESGNTTVGVVLGVLGSLLLALLEVEVDGLVCQTKLLKDDGDLPTTKSIQMIYVVRVAAYHPLGPPL